MTRAAPLAALLLILAGCATPPPATNDCKGLSDTAAAACFKNRSAGAHCGRVASMAGTANIADFWIEQSALGANGATITLDPDTCRMTIQMLPKALPPPAP